MTDQVPAGWYPDPSTPGRVRRWEGTAWTLDVKLVEEPPQSAPAHHAWTPAPSGVRPAPQQQSRAPAWQGTNAYPGVPARRGRGSTRKVVIWTLLVGAFVAASLVIYSLVSTPSGPASFTGDSDTGTTTISWLDDGSGHLTGSIQRVFTDPAAAADGLTSIGFTGTRHKGQVSITISMLGISSTWLGTLHGDILTLNIPNDDGTTRSADLIRTTPMGMTERLGAWVTETWRLIDNLDSQLDN